MSLEKAKALAANGRIAEAEVLFDELLKAKSKNPVVLTTYVRFHNRYSRKFRKAALAVETLVALKPKSGEAQALAAETYSNCQRLSQADHHAALALRIDAQDPDHLFIAAHIDAARNRPDAALAKLDLALARRPDHLPSLVQKGRSLRASGDLEGAETLARGLWAAHSDDMNLIELIFSVGTIAGDDPVLTHLETQLLPPLAAAGGVAYADALRLLAKARLDAGAHDAAFETYRAAKAAAPMRRDVAGYDTFIETLTNTLTQADFGGATGVPNDRPVLIVGFPRSGSTLLEQMLTRHSQIASVGESPALNVLCQSTGMRSHHGPDMVAAIRQIPPDATRSFAQRYLAETELNEPATRVIDKSLHNFELLGLFAKMLPHARIIDMRRDPLDTCVSCYMQPLPAWHSYTQDLGMLGRSYLQYRNLMAHWSTVLPNPMLTLHYEDLVAKPGDLLREVSAFLGLEYEPEMLDYTQSKTHSRTLSTAQVRKPLYKSAIRRWQNYEKYLDPLKSELKLLYPDGWTGPYL